MPWLCTHQSSKSVMLHINGFAFSPLIPYINDVELEIACTLFSTFASHLSSKVSAGLSGHFQ